MKKLITILFLFSSVLLYAEETKVTTNSVSTNEQTINLLEKKIDLLEENVNEYKDNQSSMISWIGILATIFTLSGIFIPIILTRRREKNIDEQIEELNSKIEEIKISQQQVEKQSLINKLFTEALNVGNIQKAIYLYSEIIKNNPNFVEAYINRGVLYSKNSKTYYKAEFDYNKAIELNDNYVEAYINRGNLYAKNPETYKEALSDYNKAIELNANDPNIYILRGILYSENSKTYKEALSDYNKAIELNPNNPDAYFVRGNLFCRNPETYKEALSEYSKVIELNPDDAVHAYQNRSLLLTVMAQIEKDTEKKKQYENMAYSDTVMAKKNGFNID